MCKKTRFLIYVYLLGLFSLWTAKSLASLLCCTSTFRDLINSPHLQGYALSSGVASLASLLFFTAISRNFIIFSPPSSRWCTVIRCLFRDGNVIGVSHARQGICLLVTWSVLFCSANMRFGRPLHVFSENWHKGDVNLWHLKNIREGKDRYKRIAIMIDDNDDEENDNHHLHYRRHPLSSSSMIICCHHHK